MWVVEAQFDGGAARRKLLKPYKTYKVGRKEPADLVLASKTVSQLTTVFEVGPFKEDDVTGNFSKRPTLTLRNEHEKKALHILRAGHSSGGHAQEGPESAVEEDRTIEELAPGATIHLSEGDDVLVTNNISITVRWYGGEFLAGFKTDKDVVSSRLAGCAQLGIHLTRDVKFWVKGASHLCVGQVKMTPTVLRAVASLAHIVTIDYLDEVLRLGSLTGSATDRPSLETSFELPSPADFFPQYISPELSAEEGKQSLQRNPARAQLFAGMTALIIHTGSELDSRCKVANDFIQAGGGQVEFLSSDTAGLSSESEAQRTLLPYKTSALSFFSRSEHVQNAPDGGLVVVVVDGVQYSGDEAWYKNLVLATRSMDIKMPDEGITALTLALIKCDPRDRLNVTASLSNGLATPSQADMGREAQEQQQQLSPTVAREPTNTPLSMPEPSMPIPTAATAGSEPPAPVDARVEQSPPAPTASFAGPGTQDPEAQGSKRGGDFAEPRRPLKRKPPTGRSNPFDALIGGSSSNDLGSAPMDTQEPVIAAGPSKEVARPAEDHPSSSISTAALRRRTKDSRASRMSSIFRASYDPEGPEGTQGSSVSDESFRKSKPFRALLEEEDHQASQGANGTEVNGSASSERRQGEESAPTPQVSRAAESSRKRRGSHEDVDMADAETGPAKKRQAAGARTANRAPREEAEVEAEHEQEEEESQSAAALSRRKKEKQQQQAQGGVIRGGDGPRGKGLNEAPDDEPHFLQALATHKKGKRALDEFDKEFNNLKLTKPAAAKGKGPMPTAHTYVEDEAYNAWKATELDDFDMPVGNYVQVDYVPLVYKRPSNPANVEGRNEWRGVPNFKKFKSKDRGQRKPVIMDLTEQQDFGMGDEYLEKVKFGLQVAEDPRDDMPTTKTIGSTINPARKGAANNILDALRDSDEEEDEYAAERQRSTARPAVSKRPATQPAASKAKRAAPPATSATQRRRAHHAVVSDDEEGDQDESALPDLRIARRVEDADFDDSLGGGGGSAPRGTASGAGAKGGSGATKRRAMDLSEPEEGESDSDGGFRGFKGTQRRGPVKKKGRI